MICVVDAGLGNLRSVEKAIAHVGGDVLVSSDPADVARADRVVVPGQGAFGDCGRALSRQAPLGRAILAAIDAGKPYLGICLGLQVLFERSDESADCPGLGVFRGAVVRIPDGLTMPPQATAVGAARSDDRSASSQASLRGPEAIPLKVPHMGWNEVVPSPFAPVHPVLAAALRDLGDEQEAPPSAPYYFVHSFHAVPAEPRLVAATARYGPLSLTAAVALGNIFAVQFHPEKSQRAGQSLLAAFLAWNP